eukprot:scaffold32_cov120-Isochrysis_galbana.AAC.3
MAEAKERESGQRACGAAGGGLAAAAGVGAGGQHDVVVHPVRQHLRWLAAPPALPTGTLNVRGRGRRRPLVSKQLPKPESHAPFAARPEGGENGGVVARAQCKRFGRPQRGLYLRHRRRVGQAAHPLQRNAHCAAPALPRRARPGGLPGGRRTMTSWALLRVLLALLGVGPAFFPLGEQRRRLGRVHRPRPGILPVVAAALAVAHGLHGRGGRTPD